MQTLLWWCGMGLAIMIGGALGGSFVRERGRAALPIVVVATLVTGVVLGWALATTYGAIDVSGDVR